MELEGGFCPEILTFCSYGRLEKAYFIFFGNGIAEENGNQGTIFGSVFPANMDFFMS
jgi:hypothetical protein